MRLRFVVPADVDSPTGGNVYDLAVADAMSRDGDEVEVVRCHPPRLYEAVDRPSAAGHTLVDGLLACAQPEVVASAPVGVVVHMPLAHDTGLSPERARRLDSLERLALHAAHPVVATSHWTADYLGRHHNLPNVAVAPPGVLSAAVSAGSDPPLLVQLAAFLPHKNQLGVVAALGVVRDLPWRARLAGAVDRDARYTALVRQAVAAAGLTARIEIPGAVPRDVAWAGADLALLPSTVEGYGMVVTEALARGVPAIVSDGGPAEALGFAADGSRPGVVISAGDPDALTRALRRWLSDERTRNAFRSSALSRRTHLQGWETTARLLREALLNA